WELMVERMNSDLANILGNLVNRTISMSNKYFGGEVRNGGASDAVDEDLKNVVLASVKKAESKMNELRVADAITEIFNIFRRCNKYIDETMPWVLAKSEDSKSRLATVLYNLVDCICVGASLLQSFMPGTCENIFRQLNAQPRTWENLDKTGLYPSGNKVTETPEILFARLDVDEVIAKVEEKRLAALPLPEIEVEPQLSEKVDFDTFCKSDFRVVKVKACEAVKKSDKLLRFTLDDGTGTDRQILSGIHKWYEPQDLIGKTLIAIVNLPPRKMMGLESCGMLISAVHKEKGEECLHLVMADDSIPAGAKLC
ncbi:MAG: class I tRNA ligase family protein, partial [Neglectibacter timonensis]